jgi:hypothetical protein
MYIKCYSKSTLSCIIIHAHFREQYNLHLYNLMKIDAQFSNTVSIQHYQPNVIRPLRVAIRNIHTTISHDDIIFSLSDLDVISANVHDIERFLDDLSFYRY